MKSSKQSKREAKQLFRASTVNGQVDEQRIRQSLNQLVEKKPRGYVAIMTHMQRMVKLDIARRTATVESATALTPDVEQSVRGKLEAVYGRNLILSFKQNPALIGGLRIQVGSDVYDGSVRARLDALANAA